MTTKKDLLGQRFGKLTVIEEGPIHVSRGGHRATRWTCRCDCNNVTSPFAQDLRRGLTRSCGCLRAEMKPAPRGSGDVGYDAAHKRVKATRGPANEYQCIGCGNQAEHWSHVPGPRSKQCPFNGRWYSPAPNDYAPRCRPCHTKFDREHAE